MVEVNPRKRHRTIHSQSLKSSYHVVQVQERIVDRHHIDRVLFDGSTQDQATDAAEPRKEGELDNEDYRTSRTRTR